MASERAGTLEELFGGGPDERGPSRAIVELAGRSIGLVQVDGRVYALRNRCPHQGGPVCEGLVTAPIRARVLADGSVQEYLDSGRLVAVCPWHGSEFDLETGTSLANPAWRVRAYRTEVRDGVVWVEV
jgi:nitrite reductase/ring-hydroxylating ferredoxin subunit